jgi:hypothetical protein
MCAKTLRIRLCSSQPTGIFWLFKHLGAALAKSIKADRTDDFCGKQKDATPERPLRKKTRNLTSGATE